MSVATLTTSFAKRISWTWPKPLRLRQVIEFQIEVKRRKRDQVRYRESDEN
jgi:hypothetical protein